MYTHEMQHTKKSFKKINNILRKIMNILVQMSGNFAQSVHLVGIPPQPYEGLRFDNH